MPLSDTKACAIYANEDVTIRVNITFKRLPCSYLVYAINYNHASYLIFIFIYIGELK